MLSKVKSLALSGLKGYAVSVEADIHPGLPAFETVGLPDAAVRESKERVRSALKNSGYGYPADRIVINLSPADTKKEGALYDLPIALGLLCASGQAEGGGLSEFAVLGELSLDGSLVRINGLLPLLISAREAGIKKFIVPAANAVEAGYIHGTEVYAAGTLREAADLISKKPGFSPVKRSAYRPESAQSAQDFCFIKGQAAAKRALEIAAAGAHNVLLSGPPGSGKTMLSKSLISILPPLTFDEALEVTKIHSVSGELDPALGIVSSRPFRSPHHTATTPSLAGGGKNVRPGEISMAHLGVLYLDEMPEYSRSALESLRQPMEDGRVTISRASGTVEYPARFMLAASMNPCPCGNFGASEKDCRCTPNEIKRYLARISGPLLDRIDLHAEADSVSFEHMSAPEHEEPSSAVRQRVERARQVQRQRFEGTGIRCNAEMSTQLCAEHCALGGEASKLLKRAFDALGLSARGYTRVLKVARTIADLSGSSEVQSSHIAEAVQYRSPDRKFVL